MCRVPFRLAVLAALAAAPAVAQPLDPADCLAPPYTAADTPVRAELAALAADLRAATAAFPSLAETLETAGARLCLTGTESGASGWFAPAETLIVLHDGLAPDMRRVVALHELRHLDQAQRGACPSPALARTAYADAVLAMEADASAIAALVARAWAEAGTPGPWAALAAWPSQADIAARLDAELAAGAPPETAVAAAFDQWYARPERRDSYWFAACSAWLDREDATHLLRSDAPLDPGFWSGLCRLPDGAAYPCAPPDD